MGGHRDAGLEARLQGALNDGKSVWAVGDVHGCRRTFEALLDKLDLSRGDLVLCIGDLVDRGPDSHGVLTIVHERDEINSLLGNHELIMADALRGTSARLATFWKSRIGGGQTLASMPGNDEQQRQRAIEWLEFTDTLPTEVVLDRFRLVHAGYRPHIPLEEQTDEDRLKSRTVFLAERPPDVQRQVIAGHTPVQKLDTFGAEPPTDGIWASTVETADGRPAILLIDTGVVLERSLRPRLSAVDLQTGRIEDVERIETFNEGPA
ncbi:MAG: metallophosphoesterase [Candidatus Thalassarchaeaceae archaeon]|jgi:serine/threonine protein phosphatase 1|nr:metallophosphoesterase [Candidatus Thalassarchaeaceae archaeon]MDP7003880.1 metallophosphoesterase [Candidatus Thalassarchaeaceae archaeon]